MDRGQGQGQAQGQAQGRTKGRISSPDQLSGIERKRWQRILHLRRSMESHVKIHYDRAVTGRSRSEAITSFCLRCCGGFRKLVKNCTDLSCELYPYRPFIGSTIKVDFDFEAADAGADSTSHADAGSDAETENGGSK